MQPLSSSRLVVAYAAAVGLLPSTALKITKQSTRVKDERVMTEVVNLLKDMLTQSRTEGETERVLYAKYKCYCDTNAAEKADSIKKLKGQIEAYKGTIEELLGSTAVLSEALAKLKEDRAANRAAKEKADNIRGEELGAYNALKGDLEAAQGQLRNAIQTLTDVNADQTAFLDVPGKRQVVQQALMTASALMSKQKAQKYNGFLQKPFTGNYMAQSGEVVGILKDMLDTFTANLKEATDTENQAITAHGNLVQTLNDEYSDMGEDQTAKKRQLGDNDGELSSTRGKLNGAVESLGDDESFVSTLVSGCDEKATQFNTRNDLRSQENAALAKAISILNSDAAFEAFGKTSTTSQEGLPVVGFLQVHASRSQASSQQVQSSLRRVLATHSFPRLRHILVLLQGGNPFDVVLGQIEKMRENIDKEQEADEEQKQWCIDERTETDGEIERKDGDITAINGSITDLQSDIENPETGLNFLIAQTEDALKTNHESQVSETKLRKEENEAYQANIAALVKAHGLIISAKKALQAYYEKEGFLQVKGGKEDPAPPDTFGDDYTGQSESASSVITLLDFIASNTKEEENQAHQAEMDSQHSYEDSMNTLLGNEKESQGELAGYQEVLAEKQGQLRQKEKDLTATQAEKDKLNAYLVSIKPGCDFIADNFDLRTNNRATEKGALGTARDKLKASPAYVNAVQAAHLKSMGDCKDICVEEGEDNAKCKACLADVSVPGYCAGHPETVGCESE